MAGSGVSRLRAARKSPRALPIESNPTRPGRYSGAPQVPPGQYKPSAPAKPGTFKKYDDVPFTLPKAGDRGFGKEGKKGPRRQETVK